MDYKKILNRVTFVFIGVLLILTFFSRTLMDLQIPRVSLAIISPGQINPQAVGSGIVVPANTERIFAPVGGRITQILERGEETDATTILFTITSDKQTLQDNLEQTEHELRLNTIAIEQTNSNREYAQQRLTQIQNQPLDLPNQPTLNLWEFDMQLESNTSSMENALRELATHERLFEQGAIARQDLLNREAEITRISRDRQEIYTRRDRAIEDFETAMLTHIESVGSAQRTRAEQISAQENVIAGHNFTLSTQNMERERIERRLNDLQEQIEGGGVIYVRLPEDAPPNRLVSEIAAGIEIGSVVSEGAPILTTALRNNRFVIETSFPQIQDFIDTGQDVDVSVGTQTINGTTARIVPDGGRNTVFIHVTSGQLLGGEMAQVTVSGGNTNHPNIIPLSALHEDEQGYYILFIMPQARRFGSSYYVMRMQVEATRRDDRHVAISTRWGMELPEEPIILNSDMPITVGRRVRLVATDSFTPTR